MNLKLKKAYLEYYFGNYLVNVPKDELAEYLEKFEAPDLVFYKRGNREELLRVGFCFLAHNQTYKTCFKIFGYDLIEFFLNHTEIQNSETFYDIPEDNLIIYHPVGTTSNNRLVSLVKHVLVFRAFNHKRTLILSEEDILKELEDGQTSIVNLNNGDLEGNYDSLI